MSAAMAKKNAPTPTAIVATTRTTRCNSRVNGVIGAGVIVVIRAISARRIAVPVAVTTASASPSTANVPANSSSPTSTADASLSPVSIEVSTSKPCAEVVVRVGRDAIPRREEQDVAHDDVASVDLDPLTVAPDDDRPREQRAQSRRGVIGAALLDEREEGVDDDDDDDGNRQRRQPGEHRQAAGDPQHDGEEVKELVRQQADG